MTCVTSKRLNGKSQICVGSYLFPPHSSFPFTYSDLIFHGFEFIYFQKFVEPIVLTRSYPFFSREGWTIGAHRGVREWGGIEQDPQKNIFKKLVNENVKKKYLDPSIYKSQTIGPSRQENVLKLPGCSTRVHLWAGQTPSRINQNWE